MAQGKCDHSRFGKETEAVLLTKVFIELGQYIAINYKPCYLNNGFLYVLTWFYRVVATLLNTVCRMWLTGPFSELLGGYKNCPMCTQLFELSICVSAKDPQWKAA